MQCWSAEFSRRNMEAMPDARCACAWRDWKPPRKIEQLCRLPALSKLERGKKNHAIRDRCSRHQRVIPLVPTLVRRRHGSGFLAGPTAVLVSANSQRVYIYSA